MFLVFLVAEFIQCAKTNGATWPKTSKLQLFMKIAVFAVALCAGLPAWAVPVSLQVLGPDDKPLAQARVSLSEGQARETKPLATAEPVGPQGAFNFEWSGVFPAPNAPLAEKVFPKNPLWARIEAPGMATQTRLLLASATTIRLGKARSWSGIVFDSDQKPLAGVGVEVWRWSEESLFDDSAAEFAAAQFAAADRAWPLKSVTDAEGRWKIDGLPERGRALLVLNGPLVVTNYFEAEIRESDAPPLFAERGAALSGRLVAPDGKPLKGVPISISANGGLTGDETAFTDATGRFAISGLRSGVYSLQFTDYSGAPATDPGFLLPALSNITARAGQTNDLGVHKAQRGIIMRGQVVDAQSKKPIQGARLSVWSESYSTTSDAQGNIFARVLPQDLAIAGESFGLLGAPLYSEKFLDMPARKAGTQNIYLGVMTLQRGVVPNLFLRVRGETASSQSDLPSLSLVQENNSTGINFYDATTPLAEPVMAAGTYRVQLDINGEPGSAQWRLISPQTITVPAPGAPRPRVEIVVERSKPVPAPLREVRGRVVDEQGVGIAGAVVTGGISVGRTRIPQTTLSDREGRFVFRGSYVVAPITIEVKRPGYELTTTPVTKFEGDIAYVDALTLTRR